MPVHISIREACARHNCSRSALYNLIGQGKITAVKHGRRTLVVVASADAHFASLPPAQIKAPALTSTKPEIAKA
jgi:excisionase family DNA binding protein